MKKLIYLIIIFALLKGNVEQIHVFMAIMQMFPIALTIYKEEKRIKP